MVTADTSFEEINTETIVFENRVVYKPDLESICEEYSDLKVVYDEKLSASLVQTV